MTVAEPVAIPLCLVIAIGCPASTDVEDADAGSICIPATSSGASSTAPAGAAATAANATPATSMANAAVHQ